MAARPVHSPRQGSLKTPAYTTHCGRRRRVGSRRVTLTSWRSGRSPSSSATPTNSTPPKNAANAAPASAPTRPPTATSAPQQPPTATVYASPPPEAKEPRPKPNPSTPAPSTSSAER